jgi:hypothetical protein
MKQLSSEQDSEKRQDKKFREESKKERKERKKRRRKERMAGASEEASKPVDTSPQEVATMFDAVDDPVAKFSDPCPSPKEPKLSHIVEDPVHEVAMADLPEKETTDQVLEQSEAASYRPVEVPIEESTDESAEEPTETSDSPAVSEKAKLDTSTEDDDTVPSSVAAAKAAETVDPYRLTPEQLRACEWVHNLPWKESYEKMIKTQILDTFTKGLAREIDLETVRTETEDANGLWSGLLCCNHTIRKKSRKLICQFAVCSFYLLWQKLMLGRLWLTSLGMCRPSSRTLTVRTR